MLFWLCVIFLLVFMTLAFVSSAIEEELGYSLKNWKCAVSNLMAEINVVSIVAAAMLGLTIFIMLIVIGCVNISGAGYVAENEQRYEALLYKSQTDSIRDELGIVNKEYVDEVQEWNEEVVKYDAYSKSKWIGIFYPEKYYGDWKTIDLNDIKMRK